jgi:protein O-GlcNAc transferase
MSKLRAAQAKTKTSHHDHAAQLATQLVNAGLAALQQGVFAEADAKLREALRLDATNVQALHGMGLIAHHTGNYAPAMALFDEAILHDSKFFAAHVNRGNTLAALQHWDAAIASFNTALAISPGLPSALVNLASTLQAKGEIDAAVAALQQALATQPDAPETWNNLGNLFKEAGFLQDAINAYDRALAIKPNLPQAFSNRLAAQKLDPTRTPATILEAHREWSIWFEAEGVTAPVLNNDPRPDRPLRIGYVSPDCHTALPAFIHPVIAAHDRAKFNVYCYFNNPQSDETLANLGVTDAARVMKGMSDDRVTEMIHQDQIDILIDIAGHTGHNRLGVFAQRAAPVQITWLDYLSTTGLEAMDYRITDAVADPAGAEAGDTKTHTETLLRMPNTQWCWRPPKDAPSVDACPQTLNGYVTFGSFNNAIKLTDATLMLWRKLMIVMPTARLVIGGIATGFARERVVKALAMSADRLTFLPRVDEIEYRRAYGRIDIALDPMPFSGATTTLDALWQGVPVLTLPGATSCSRSSASLLTALSMRDWIARDVDDWLVCAQRHSGNVAALTALRTGLRARLSSSSICESEKFTRDLEAQYRSVWQQWCHARSAAVVHMRARKANEPLALLAADEALTVANRLLAQSEGAAGGLDTVALDRATELFADVLRIRPSWDLARKEAASAYFAWAKQRPENQAAWVSHVPGRQEKAKVSAVICSIRPDYFAHIKSRLKARFSKHDIEVIGIHDATSLCEGYNRGAAKAKGDVLIFCHDDIDIVHEDFADRVIHHLKTHDLIGVAGTSRLVNGDWGHGGLPYVHGQILHRPREEREVSAKKMSGFIYLGVGLQQPVAENIQALDGVFFAMRRQVWETLRFDAATFNGFHLYDIDFSYRAHLAGYKLAIPLDLLLVHFSTGRYDVEWQKHNLRFLAKFPALSNRPNINRYANLHVKLQTLEQVERLHRALLHYRFGEISAPAHP